MYGCESWTVKKAEPPKNWCFLIVVLKKTLESPLDCKEIKAVNPKRNLSWIFTGRTDAEAPILWLPDAKKWLTWKDLDAGKGWRQEEKGTTEDKMVGCHHRLNGGKPGLLMSMGSQRGRHDWMTELDWQTSLHLLTTNALSILPSPSLLLGTTFLYC